MKSLREYIDLIEQAKTDEGFGQRTIPRPVFGQRMEPSDPETRSRLEKAKQYSTAHEYAIDHHPEWPMRNTDPPQLKARIQQKYDGLTGEWNNWKKAGFIGQ